jgi:hypothetical protein
MAPQTTKRRPRPPRKVPAYTVVCAPSTPDPKAAAAVLRWLAARIR